MITKLKEYYVYILTNHRNTTLYIGVTNNLLKRVNQHKAGNGSEFTKKYKTHKLVYYETTNDALAAIVREKQLKAGSRSKKIELINSMNPGWEDLYEKFLL